MVHPALSGSIVYHQVRSILSYVHRGSQVMVAESKPGKGRVDFLQCWAGTQGSSLQFLAPNYTNLGGLGHVTHFSRKALGV